MGVGRARGFRRLSRGTVPETVTARGRVQTHAARRVQTYSVHSMSVHAPAKPPRGGAAGEVGAGSAAPPGRAVLGVRPRGVGVSCARRGPRSGLKARAGAWPPPRFPRLFESGSGSNANRASIIFEQFDSGERAGILRYERGGTIGTLSVRLRATPANVRGAYAVLGIQIHPTPSSMVKNSRFHQTVPPPLGSPAPAARRWTLG